jgi:hypothetical protein
MKRYKLFVLAALLSGCSDFLDVVPTDRFTDETFWKTEEHAVAGVTAAYNSLYSVYGGSVQAAFDALTPNFFSYNNSMGSANIARGIHDAANTALINDRWGAAYQGIGRANTALARLPEINMNETLKQRFIGEAQFLRALYYYSLWSVYGGVPRITATPSLEQGSLPRNTAGEIEQLMLADLDAAISRLPNTYGGADKGRATKGAALTLKAKILLQTRKWDQAAAAAKAVMDLKAYSLHPNFRAAFQEEAQGNQEVLFDLQYKQPEYTHSNDINFDQFNSYAPTQNVIDEFYMTDGKPFRESPLYNPAQPYANRDPRLLQTVMYVGSNFKGKVVNAETYPRTGYGLKKGTTYQDAEAPPASKVDNISDLNIIVFRYADVLLMYAEAQNEAVGPDASVFEALNLLRKRVAMPNFSETLSKEELRQEIRHERRIELLGEGSYYFDVKRWQIADNELNQPVFNRENKQVEARSFNPNRDVLWPIPTMALQANPNLEQNPNYTR